MGREEEQDIYRSLAEKEVGRCVLEHTKELSFDYNQYIESSVTKMLGEIVEILQSATIESDDFVVVEEIMTVLRSHGISCGGCHDF